MLTAENQRLLEAIQKGICILDAQGLVLAANTAFLRIARCNAAHLLGHSLGEFMINLSVTELYHKLPLRNIALNFSEEISLTVDLAPFSIAAGCMGAVAVIRDDGEMQELRDALETAMNDKSIGIILLTERFGREFPDLIDEIKLKRKMPLLIEIPDRHGTGRKKDFITSYVNEAIGLKL